MLVYDTRRTYRVPNDNTCGRDRTTPGSNDVGQVMNSDGTSQLCAAGYRYLMFQVGRFATTPSGCSTTPTSLYANRRMLARVYTKEYNDPPSGCPTQ